LGPAVRQLRASFNPLRIALHEYVGIARDQLQPTLTGAERIGYLFGPPGWRPGGLGHTTAALRAADSARRKRQALLGDAGAA